MSPVVRGSWASLVICSPLSAATTCRSSGSDDRGRGLGQRGRPDRARARARTGGDGTEALDGDLRRGPSAGLLVLGGLVDVDHRVELGVEGRDERVGPQGRVVEADDPALVEEEGRAEAVGLDEGGHHRRQARAVGGGQRLRVAAGDRQRHVDLRRQRTEHGADERRVQERQVGGADEGGVGPVDQGGQADRDPLQRAEALARVGRDLDLGRQVGQLLAGRPDHDHGAGDGAGDDRDRPPQQRRAVPVQGRLGRAHAG